MSRVARRTLVTAAAALLPLAAQAHSAVPGIGHFYNGALHPFVVIPHLMALIALGLWTGQRGMQAVGGIAAAFGAGLAVGLALALTTAMPDTDLVVLCGAALVGLGVAIARPLPGWLAGLFTAALGLSIGLGSAPEGLQGAACWASVAGTAGGALLAVLWTAAMASLGTAPWVRIVVRVLGSWLTASALLVLALTWVGPRHDGMSGQTPAGAAASAPSAPAAALR